MGLRTRIQFAELIRSAEDAYRAAVITVKRTVRHISHVP
jgi:hypothetical protein